MIKSWEEFDLDSSYTDVLVRKIPMNFTFEVYVFFCLSASIRNFSYKKEIERTSYGRGKIIFE